MYRVVVVDDEEIIREGITRVIDWSSLGFEIARKCASANEVLEFLRHNHVDVALVDIRLPGMSGLELIAALRDQSPSIRIVILSGYDSFQYARSAIELQVFAYLLKPVKTDEVARVFSSLSDTLNRERRQPSAPRERAESRVAQAIETGDDRADWESSWAVLVEDCPWLEAGVFTVAVVDAHVEIRPVEHSSVVTSAEQVYSRWTDRVSSGLTPSSYVVLDLWARKRLVVLCRSENHLRHLELTLVGAAEELGRDCGDIRYSGVFSSRISTVSELSGLYRRMDEAIHNRIRVGLDQLFPLVSTHRNQNDESIDIGALDRLAYDFSLAFSQADSSTLSRIISSLVTVLETGNVRSIGSIRSALLRFFYGVEERLKSFDLTLQDYGASIDTFIESVLVLPEFGEIRKRLETVVQQAVHQLRQSSTRPHNHVVSAALEIISRRFREGITLEEVASEVKVTPSHLSRLFRHVLNETFKEHLTRVRIAEAKRRLTSTNDKVYAVAESVGFRDQRYFTEVFRKQTGVSPVDFRNRKGFD